MSSALFHVLCNGVVSESFKPSRGIRQGDPLSPYLFILSMERLGYLIEVTVEQKKWRPLFLSKRGPTLSHLIFTNDLIFFCEADRNQVATINEILNTFCQFSGQKVCEGKS